MSDPDHSEVVDLNTARPIVISKADVPEECHALDSNVHGCCITCDGRLCVVSGYTSSVGVWDLDVLCDPTLETPTNTKLGFQKHLYFKETEYEGWGMVAHPVDPNIVLMACGGGTVLGLYVGGGPDVPVNIVFAAHKVSRRLVRGVGFSGNGRKFGAASWDRKIRFFDTPELEGPGTKIDVPVALECSGHSADCISVALNSDGTRAVSGSDDSVAIVCDISSEGRGTILYTLRNYQTGWMYSVTFSPDDQYIFTGAYDGTIAVFVASDCSLITVRNVNQNKGNIRNIGCCTASNRLFVSKNQDVPSDIQGFDLDEFVNGELQTEHLKRYFVGRLTKKEKFTNHPYQFGISPDGRRFAMGNEGPNLLVFQTNSTFSMAKSANKY